MAAPLVSVILPVYNGSGCLRDAVESVLAQTYQPVELIAVNDGSTDDSADILAAYGSRLVLINQANGGVARARNAGLAAARGEFVAFLDQDDWWLPEKVAKQVELFLSDAGLGLVHTGIDQFDDRCNRYGATVYDTGGSRSLLGNCFDRLLLGNGVFNSSVMIRKSVLAKAGMFDVTLGGNTVQDFDLWLRIARHFRFGYLSEKLAVLRLHAGQGSWDRRAMLRDELIVLERAAGREELRRSPALRSRVAVICDGLGVAHLDANEWGLARRCFFRGLLSRPTSRLAALSLISLLPGSMIAWFRRQRSRPAEPVMEPLRPTEVAATP